MAFKTDGLIIPFEKALQQTQLVGRASRFIMIADLGGQIIDCHCPVPGTIGGTVLDGLPGLVSGPYPGRATEWSFEAFSYYHPDDDEFQWVGVNQTAANRYVEAGLLGGWLDPMFEGGVSEVKREKSLGASRIDFLVNEDTYLEVKMPVDNLQIDVPAAIEKRWPMASSLTKIDRAGKQATDLGDAVEAGMKAKFLTVFCYDNDGKWREWPYRKPKNAAGRSASPSAQAFARARALGMEQWRLSLRFTPTHIELLRLEQVPTW